MREGEKNREKNGWKGANIQFAFILNDDSWMQSVSISVSTFHKPLYTSSNNIPCIVLIIYLFNATKFGMEEVNEMETYVKMTANHFGSVLPLTSSEMILVAIWMCNV